MKAAAQVGLFVIVAVVLFIGGVVFVGRGLLGQKVDKYLVVMPDAGGLAKGSRVLMAGVQVGEIADVAVDTPTQAKLAITLKHGTRLPLSTKAQIQSSLVGLGDTPLTLVQDPKYRGPAGDFEPGMTILGGKAGPLDSLLPDGGTELYTEFNATLKSVRKLLENNGLQKDVRSVLATTQQTMVASQDTLRAFTRLANQSESLLAANRGQIAAILRTTEGALSSVQETALTVERFAKSNKLQGGAEGLIADAHKIAVQSQALLNDLHRTLNDPKLNADLRATADNLTAASGNLTTVSGKLPALTDKADRIAANVESLTGKSQDLPEKLGNVLDGAADLEKRLGGLADKVGGVLGKKPKGLPPVSAQFDLIRESNPGYWRTDLNLTVPLDDGFVTAGLWDAFERNRVNLQLGTNVNSALDYRYGIYGGRPGVGVDYRLAPRLGFRGDLWDINDPRFDARLRYEFGGGLIGWLGVDRLFQHPGLTVGVGVRR